MKKKNLIVGILEKKLTDSKDWTGNKASVYKTLAASNHSSSEREKNKDCDFFVGVTNFQVITAHDVALQVLKFFNDNGAKE